MIGAVIIKHKLGLSDAETVQQIQENPYMQYFVGLSGYQKEVPFAASLFVDIRKRMGESVFEGFHQAIIDVQAEKEEKTKPESDDQETPQNPSEEQSDERESLVSEGTDVDNIQKTPATHQGKLILDATVVEQAIRYPTDLSLLNEAREFSEKIIDKLYPHTGLIKKPRTHRKKARKAFLAIVKQRRPGRKKIRRGIKQQLQYLRRNLGHIEL